MNDEVLVEETLSVQREGGRTSGLDPKTRALARLGSLIAVDASTASYQADTSMALGCGATLDEIVGALIAVAPIVGSAKVVSAARAISLAIGYDVDADLETVDPPHS